MELEHLDNTKYLSLTDELDNKLQLAYAEMALDSVRENEAAEWVEGTIVFTNDFACFSSSLRTSLRVKQSRSEVQI